MAYTTAQGCIVTFGKNADDQLDSPYDIKEWAAATEYHEDDAVITNANTGDAVQQWRATMDHTSDSTEQTASTDAVPAQLSATLWEKDELGSEYGVTDWTITRGINETSRRLLREATPRVNYGTAPVTLDITVLDNFQGSRVQRVLSVPNTRVYVKLYPKGKGKDLEVIQGYMRVGESSQTSGDGDTDVSRTVTLASDGDFVSSAQA